MYIKDIEIRRFMAFESAETEFLYPGAPNAGNVRLPNMNVVIGDNGAGKTALLKAVAYALLSPVFANSQPYATRLVRTTSDYNPSTIMAASVKLPNQRDHEPADAEGTRLVSRIEHGKKNARFAGNDTGWAKAFKAHPYSFFVAGYDAERQRDTRMVVHQWRQTGTNNRKVRVETLVDNLGSPREISGWVNALNKRDPDRHLQAHEIIAELMPKNMNCTENGQFNVAGHPTLQDELPESIRLHASWSGDLVYHLCRICPEGRRLREQQGVVLIDGVDTHMDPAMQLEILERISTTLPHLQFIVTTNSALTAGTAERANLLQVTASGDSRGSKITRAKRETYGLNAEQLYETLFHMRSTRAPAFAARPKAVSGNVSANKPGASKIFLSPTTTPREVNSETTQDKRNQGPAPGENSPRPGSGIGCG